MIIGIPKEVKTGEWRVALPPKKVGALVEAGHAVLVERSAGEGAGWPDRDYRKTGARLVMRAELFAKAALIVKVKEPQPAEYRLLRRGVILFAFLHLAANRRLAGELKRRQVKAIPYEMIRTEEGHLPLLAPMSEIAGQLAALIGANYLRKDLGGKGSLLSAVGSGRPGRVVVIGAGRVGSQAARTAHGLGATVTLYDINRQKLEAIQGIYRDRLEVIFEPSQLPEAIRRADLLIGAVLVPGRQPPKIVTRAMVRSMEKGSVVIDVAVDEGGCIETIRPTTLLRPVYERYGVLHCGVTNLPSLVPRAASIALSEATFPYLLRIARGETILS